MKNSNTSHVIKVPLCRKRTLGDVGFNPNAAFEQIGLKQLRDAYSNKSEAGEFSVTVHRLEITG